MRAKPLDLETGALSLERDVPRGTVWIVEDSALEAEMARRALAPTQETEVIGDGSLALERFANGSVPDVVVLDWQLPTVSGLEVCRTIRATHDANVLPILMLTAQSRKQELSFAIAAGANDYVTKPYDVAELVARVRTLVRTSHLQRAQLRRARQLELAANVGAALTRARGVEEIAHRCTEILARHFDAAFAGMWLVRDEALSLVSRSGDSNFPAPGAMVRECASRRGVIRRAPLVAVPLLLGDEVVGALAVASGHVNREAAAILSSITDLVALGAARARAEAERRELLERERAARADAEAANRHKDEFLATVSHELRTPLSAITGWTAMLKEGELDAARTRRAIDTIERNARAQKQLIEDLLDVTRIVAGKLRIERGRVDVASVVELALESIRFAAEAKSVTVTSSVPTRLPAVLGDSDRLQQVAWNLLTNAIKFTPRDGRVHVAVEAVGDAVEIVVRDSGAGIAPDFLPFVFERFRQAAVSETGTASGLGLGLAIVRHLVELHGGAIAAESEGLGRGATFRVRLPSAMTSVHGPRIGEDAPTQLRGLDGLRVLIVDDEPDAREMLRMLLERHGVVVTTSSSAADAFEALRTTRPDVLLSDLGMPVEDGLSLMRRVRRLPPDEGGAVPAVALTAYTRAEDRTSALHAGFTKHLAKPLNVTELVGVLAGLTRARA